VVALTRLFQRFSLDLLGISASALCAIHCAIFPILFLFGFIGADVAHNHKVENYILLGSAVVGMLSLLPAYLRHKKMLPLAILLLGLALIGISRLVHAETFFTVAGACLVAGAHYLNWKISHHHTNSSERKLE
jgi:hypothetical protein